MEGIRINDKLCLSPIGYGTYPQKESLTDIIPTVYSTGYRLIDTSDNYLNEEFAGKALKDLPDDIVVVTKFSQPGRSSSLETCFKESEDKLSRKINLYLLHWPYPYLMKYQWRKMEKLYTEGKVDAIGVCNFEEKHLKKLLSFCKIKPAVNQYERHPIFQQGPLTEFCHKNGIAVMSYSPLARLDKRLTESPVLKKLAEKYGKTVGQIVLRWDIDTECIPIPGASSSEHIKENFDIFDFSLSSDEINEINSLEQGARIRIDPNKHFSAQKKLKFLLHRIKHIF